MGQPNPAELGPSLIAGLLQDAGTTGVFPLSFAQESLWFLEQMAPGNPVYNIPEGWRLQGRLNVAALERNLTEIFRRHETLRTVFGENEGKPVQIIKAPQPFRLPLIDLQERGDKEAELQRFLAEEACRAFDFRRGPLARFHLLRMAAEEHVLLLNLHHIISDAWSLDVLLRELAELYGAEVTGGSSALCELPIQFADFAVWQRQALEENLPRELGYWEKQLQGLEPQLALPTDHSRPASQSYRGATQFFAWDKGLTEGLKELSRREGVTLFMTLLAGFQTLLQRYTRQDDIVVGSPTAGRDRVETEGLIGMLVNTLPLRTDLSGDPAFVELLKRVREVTLNAYAHKEMPLEKLVNALQPNRDLSYHPLFQVVFGLQTSSTEAWTLPGLTAKRIELDSGTAKFDWTLLLTETGEGLRGRFEYNTDLFDSGAVSRLVHQFELLLKGIIAAPGRRLSEFSLLDSAEREQLLAGWNQTVTAYERDQCVHEIFEAQAAKTPDSVALVFEKRQMTYGELERRANQLAEELQRRGAGPDVLVGLCVERSFEMIVGMLAILKAGGAYVPLDPMYPRERLAFMLEDARIGLLLTREKLRESLPKSGAQILYVEAFAKEAGAATVPRAAARSTAANLAYVVYTSGSTGTPKGTMIPHRGLVRLVRNTNYVQFSAEDVFLQMASVTFDASTFEIWGALLNGAKLAIFPPHLPSFEELSRIIEREQVTTLWLTAGLFHQMVEHHIEKLSGVRKLLAGGEALSVPHVVKAARELSGCTLINGYGPTENTTFTCCHRVPAGWSGGRSVPIGRPISNTQVYVLDQRLEPTPVGVPGELYIGGDGLARGYLNRPELTAEKFVTNPFSPKEARSTLYRTGDLVRWLPGGDVEFLGRLDEQVKVRGFRVEPGEIQTVLEQHPLVRQAFLMARGDRSATKHLVAYLVLRENNGDSEADLREFLGQKLPAYMVPSHFVQLTELPLTPNGKVDRRALPEPGIRDSAGWKTEAPRNATETALAGIWSELLGCKAVGIHDNFFHLGGHSLLATQLVSRITRVFQVELPVRSVFEAPTIAGLAEAVAEAVQNEPAPAPVIARRGSTRAETLLTRLEELSDAEVEELLSDPELQP